MHNSGLMRRLTKLAAEIIKETTAVKSGQSQMHEISRPLRPEEEYVSDSLIYAGELITICDQMLYSVDFLSGFKSGRVVADKPITRLDYIVYHIEGHLIRTCSVMDRALQLVNVVFQLGVLERECRYSVIAQNSHVRRTKVSSALKNIDNATKPYRNQRNLVVHRRRHAEDSLTKIEPYYILQKERISSSEECITQRFYYAYKTRTDRFIKEKKEELTLSNQRVFSAVSEMLLALEPVFENNYAVLRNG